MEEKRLNDMAYHSAPGAKTVPRNQANKNTVCKNSSFMRILPPKSIENM